MKVIISNIILVIFILTSPELCYSQWTDVTIDTNEFYKVVKFKNQNYGFIMGDSGIILKTTNGGDTWNSIINSISHNINDFQFINDTMIYAYSLDSIIKSENSGNTWSVLYDIPPYTAKVHFQNKSLGFAGGGEGIYKSNDEGMNWDTVWNYNVGQYGFGSIQDIKFINDSIGFACGSKHISGGGLFGIILKTTDAGNNWNEIYNNSPWGYFINKIEIVNNAVIYGLTDAGNLLKSIDYGNNWEEINTNLDSESSTINSMFFKNNDTAYAVASTSYWTTESCMSKSKIFRTTDGWQTWITQYLDVTCLCQEKLLNSLYFNNASTGFAVGFKKILKTTNYGGNINIIDTIDFNYNIDKIESKNSSIKIYPNPAKNYIRIESFMYLDFKIKIINTLGEVLYQNFINKNQQEIDITEFRNGIYFVKINSKDVRKIGKFIKRE